MPADTKVGAYMDVRSANGTRGYIVDPHIWEAVVPEWIVADGKVRDLVLHPVTLGQKDSRSQRGLPRLAEGDEAKAILSHLKDLSEPYGTKIQAENGVGRVKLGIKEYKNNQRSIFSTYI